MNEYHKQVEEEAQRITDQSTKDATEQALKNVPQSAKTKKLRKKLTDLKDLIQTLPEDQQKVTKVATEVEQKPEHTDKP